SSAPTACKASILAITDAIDCRFFLYLKERLGTTLPSPFNKDAGSQYCDQKRSVGYQPEACKDAARALTRDAGVVSRCPGRFPGVPRRPSLPRPQTGAAIPGSTPLYSARRDNPSQRQRR